MSKKRTSKLERDDEEQSRLFIEKAKEIGATGRKSAADKLMAHLVTKPPKPRKRKKK